MRLLHLPVETEVRPQGRLAPVAFQYGGRRYVIREITDRWDEGDLQAGRPEITYYRVLTKGGETFLLRRSALFDAWALVVPDR